MDYKNFINHLYILLTIALTIYSQLVIKFKVNELEMMPDNKWDKFIFFINFLMNPWIISSIISTLISGLVWMIVLKKFEISYAYPFLSLNYILIIIFSFSFFNENISLQKIIGSMLIILGIIIISIEKNNSLT